MSAPGFGGSVLDEWDALSVPYDPIPGIGNTAGIYALYQGSVLKYIGEG